jgi:Family of unknown function (DUF5677)
VRRCVESAIICYASVKCPDLVLDRFKKDDYKHYKNMAKEVPRSCKLLDDDLPSAYLRKALENIEVKDGGNINLSQLAEKAGIKDIYDTIFRFLSADASHVTLDSLKKVAACDQENGGVVGISIRPRYEGMGGTLLLAAISQLEAIKALQLTHPDPDIDEMVSVYTDITRNIFKMMYPEWSIAGEAVTEAQQSSGRTD